jgi:hypothetical protein
VNRLTHWLYKLAFSGLILRFSLSCCLGGCVFFWVGLAIGQTTPPVDATEKPIVPRVSVKNPEYNQPMYFEVSDATLKLPPPEIEYDLSLDKSESLKVGNVLVNEKTFLIALRPLRQLFPHLNRVLSGKELERQVLVLRWPEALVKTGLLEMISREGKVLWKAEITDKDISNWKRQVEEWRNQGTIKNEKAETLASALTNTQMGFLDPKSLDIPLEGKQFFRFCLTHVQERAQTKLCSRRYGTKGTGSQLFMGKVKSEVKARIFLQNEDAPLSGLVPVSLELPFRFYADLASGESYEFVALATKPQLMELTAVASQRDFIQVVGFATPPNQPFEILNEDTESGLVELLGFQSTIRDPRVFWSTRVSKENSVLYFSGVGGGLFRQRLDLGLIPASEVRPFLAAKTPPGTYLKEPLLHGRRSIKIGMSSAQGGGEVSINKKNPSFFDWRFNAREKGEINRSYLSLGQNKQRTKAYFEIYRGYANELSTRLSGIMSSGDGMIMGELAYNHWFESLFGSESYWGSYQRWGVSGKYFKSLTPLKFGGSTTANLDSTTFDIKYRFVPGLWTREESMGIMGSYQSVTFEKLVAPMMGFGWFWARSMPKVFDDLFNYLPFMEYPKWVDMEFIYYTSPMDAKIKMDMNWALNFHGQVLWKKAFFGEAGFGIRRYAFSNSSINQKAELNTFYGTMGLGIKF